MDDLPTSPYEMDHLKLASVAPVGGAHINQVSPVACVRHPSADCRSRQAASSKKDLRHDREKPVPPRAPDKSDAHVSGLSVPAQKGNVDDGDGGRGGRRNSSKRIRKLLHRPDHLCCEANNDLRYGMTSKMATNFQARLSYVREGPRKRAQPDPPRASGPPGQH